MFSLFIFFMLSFFGFFGLAGAKASNILIKTLAFCYVGALLLCIQAMYITTEPPKGLEAKTVVIVEIDGTSRKIENTYYQNDSGEYYIKQVDDLKEAFVPFYRPDYVKTDLPENSYVIKE